jgi:nucleoside-diphosphate-sugar epimerase
VTPETNRNVVVVGVNGLIGRNAAKFLRDRNYAVRGVSRGYGEYREASAMEADLTGIDLRFGDISDPSFAKSSLRDVDQVVFAAGLSGVAASFADPIASRRGTVALWMSLIEKCRPGTRIVLTSSQLVYGPSTGRPFVETDPPAPASPYASHLALMEQEGGRVADQRRLEVVSLRLGNVFGDIQWLDQPRSHGMVALMLRDLVIRREIRLFGGGSQTVNLLHVRDLAEAISVVLGHQYADPLTAFNVNGERLTVSSIAKALCNGAGFGRLVSVPWPAGLAQAVARDIELDDSKFRGRYGWRPKISATEELERIARFSVQR